MNWTVRKVLSWTTQKLTEQQFAVPRLDAEVLLAHTLGVNRLSLYLDHDKPLSADELAAYREVVRRRLASEPIAYITGQKEFWSLNFAVTPAVLVPRPETELLVDLVVAFVRAYEPLWQTCEIVDVGTGSGAIAVALARELTASGGNACTKDMGIDDARTKVVQVHAIDVSAEALAVAKQNSAQNEVAVHFYQGTLLDALPTDVAPDIVVANLPYIKSSDMSDLPADVRQWEPSLALDGGSDGLALIYDLIAQTAPRIRAGGMIALELDPDQAPVVAATLSSAGFCAVQSHRDLRDVVRVVTARSGLC